jgi:hypothetical protein
VTTFGRAVARLPTLHRLMLQYSTAGPKLGAAVAVALGGGAVGNESSAEGGVGGGGGDPAEDPSRALTDPRRRRRLGFDGEGGADGGDGGEGDDEGGDEGGGEIGGRADGGGGALARGPAVAVLSEINLQGSQLSSAGAAALFSAWGTHAPRAINLEGCLPHARRSLPSLWAALGRRAPMALRQLNLGFNGLGPAEVAALAVSLQTNPWLEGLDLGSNPVGPEGVASLCDALQANPACGLHSLGLDFTNVGPVGAARLATYLSSRRCQVIQ